VLLFVLFVTGLVMFVVPLPDTTISFSLVHEENARETKRAMMNNCFIISKLLQV
jgi:hypothetical protein